MKTGRSIRICLAGVLWRVKKTKIMLRAAYSYSRTPLTSDAVETDALKSTRVCLKFWHVPLVLAALNKSKVAKCIVGPVAINVINMLLWPFSGMPKKGKSVAEIISTVYLNDYVPIHVG